MKGWEPQPDFAHLRCYKKDLADGHLKVMFGREPIYGESELQWHLAILHRSSESGSPAPGRIPTWEEIKEARYLFLPDEVNMAMMLPPMAMCVDVHPTTMLHLWQIPTELAQ